MPYSIYTSLILGKINKTDAIIQLANRPNFYLKGTLEYILVQVNELIFPTDF